LHCLREALSKARQCALTLGRKLARFLEYAELELHHAAECSELQSREVWQDRGSFTFPARIGPVASQDGACTQHASQAAEHATFAATHVPYLERKTGPSVPDRRRVLMNHSEEELRPRSSWLRTARRAEKIGRGVTGRSSRPSQVCSAPALLRGTGRCRDFPGSILSP